ncbi:MAG: DMT family protein [Gammaproteobacteria bacterium]|nr:DMT family protein [Gammaproteobacteria bacterium]
MNIYALSALMLCLSNLFMTFAWYGHLRNMAGRAWYVAALASWGIALFEYLLQVPANRIGHQVMAVGQLKILQEIITLGVFVPFSIFYLRERLTLDYLWAGLCLCGAAFFMFRREISAWAGA